MCIYCWCFETCMRRKSLKCYRLFVFRYSCVQSLKKKKKYPRSHESICYLFPSFGCVSWASPFCLMPRCLFRTSVKIKLQFGETRAGGRCAVKSSHRCPGLLTALCLGLLARFAVTYPVGTFYNCSCLHRSCCFNGLTLI